MTPKKGKRSSEIKFQITLDEKNIPETIEWQATDYTEKESKPCKSVIISIWDPEEKNTLRLDLWTKDMGIDEMHVQFFQTLVTMAESFQNATGNKEILGDMKTFCEDFSKKTPYFKESNP